MTEQITYNPDKVIREDRIEYYAKKVYKKTIKKFCRSDYIEFDDQQYDKKTNKKIFKLITKYYSEQCKFEDIKEYFIYCMYVNISKKLNTDIYKYIHSRYTLIDYPNFVDLDSLPVNMNLHTINAENYPVIKNFISRIIGDNTCYLNKYDYTFITNDFLRYLDKYTNALLLEEDDDSVDTKPAKLIPCNS